MEGVELKRETWLEGKKRGGKEEREDAAKAEFGKTSKRKRKFLSATRKNDWILVSMAERDIDPCCSHR